MNRNGQVVFYSFMIGVIVLLLSLALAPAIKSFVETSVSEMDCTNESISSFDKAGCLAADLSIFYYIGTLVVLSVSLLGSRVLLGGGQ